MRRTSQFSSKDYTVLDHKASTKHSLNRQIKQIGSTKTTDSSQKQGPENKKSLVAQLWDQPQASQPVPTIQQPLSASNKRITLDEISQNIQMNFRCPSSGMIKDVDNDYESSLKNIESSQFSLAKEQDSEFYTFSKQHPLNEKLVQTGKFANCEQITEGDETSICNDELPNSTQIAQMIDYLMDVEDLSSSVQYMQELQKLASIILFRVRTRS